MIEMRVKNIPIVRRLSYASTILAFVAAFLPATVYVWVAHADQRASLKWRADVIANELNEAINLNPDAWEYSVHLRTIIEADYGERGIQPHRKIRTERGDLVSQAGNAVSTPSIREERVLYDAGYPVGNLQVIQSFQPALVRTLYVLLFSLCFAIAIYMGFKTIPLRALRTSFERLEEEKERALVALNSIADAVIVTSPDLHVESVNRAAEKLTGWNSDEAKGRPLAEVMQIVDKELNQVSCLVARQCVSTRHTAERQNLVVLVRKTDGVEFYIQDSAAPILVGDGSLVGIVVALHDITTHIQAQRHLNQIAHHDALTGLPNRLFFHERISLAVSNAKRHFNSFAIFFLDLDHFKEVNDTLGHDAGDQLLIAVAERLLQCIRNTDTVMRMGGDEFTVILESVPTTANLSPIAEKIVASISRPFQIGEHEVFVTTSIGIAIFPEDGDDISTLVKNADTAMYRAKDGRNTYRFFGAV